MPTIMDVLIYLFYVLMDGDYLNDWYTHVPEAMQQGLVMTGQLLAVLVGY
jgi:hypothetical protein